AGARHPVLHLGCRHSEEPPRARPQRRRRAAAADPREHSRTRLLPLTRGIAMLIHPTVERLRALGLTAMADGFIELQNAPDAGELSREEWLGLLVDREATSRENKRLARRLPEARLPRSMSALERTRLLIIDDWGPEPLNAEQRRDLLEIIDDRYDRGSLLVTSQVPVNRWHEVIGDPTLADAILDRIIHRAHRIDLKRPSLRRRLVASESPAA